MDFSKNTVLKENYTFLVLDAEGRAAGAERGLYSRDTRFLHRYAWSFSPPLQTLLLDASTPYRLHSHQALLGHHQQYLAARRELQLAAGGFDDELDLEVTGGEPRTLSLELEFGADFADLFEVRGWGSRERRVETSLEEDGVEFRYRATDGHAFASRLRFSRQPDYLGHDSARFDLELEPGERWQLTVSVELESTLTGDRAGPSYAAWRDEFADLTVAPVGRAIARRAVDDLRALLLFTEEGPVPAAGIPWYVAAFGRDALLTAAMLLPRAPQVAEGTLRYLARHQGERADGYRAEAPGKIMHELRFGELARTGKVPHSPYYGTVDATPLFVVLLGRLHEARSRLDLVRELRPHWEAALTWLEVDGDIDGDGFLEFTPAQPGQGLNVQSWKDSEDSMSHADGTLARGELAVSEVQGYAFEAYCRAAEFYRELGEESAARRCSERARDLAQAFDEAFWLEDRGTYAMALDGRKRPLEVQNSDAGHLLWSGIVPAERAPRLVETLFSEPNWSGWGFRTLGSGERRYNPVSYHNGSVWPHESALIAGGLARYGFEPEARRVRDVVIELALSQNDLRLPELVAGYDRAPGDGSRLPVPYPTACRPQAWDAAALIYLLTMFPD